MGVTVIDPGEGALARALGRLGEGAAARVFAKGNREKDLRRDTAVMQSLVPAATNAIRGGPETIAAFAKGLGVGEDFVTEDIASLPFTVEQATNDAFLRGGGAEQAAGNLILSGIFEGQSLDEALGQGQPIINAIQAANEGRLAAETAETELLALRFKRENGVIQSQLDTEKIRAQTSVETATIVQEMFDGFDQTTEEGRRNAFEFGLAAELPAFLTRLGVRENLDFQAGLMLSNATTNAIQAVADTSAFTLKMKDAWTESLARLQEADEAGNEDFLGTAVQDVNTTRLLIQALRDGGHINPIDTSIASLSVGFFGGEKLKLAEQTFRDPEVPAFVVNLQEQGVTDITAAIAELRGVNTEGGPLQPDEVSAWDALGFTPRMEEDIIADFPKFLEGIESLLPGEPGIFSAETVAGEFVRGTVPAQAVATATEEALRLKNILSFEMQAVLDALGAPAGQGEQTFRGLPVAPQGEPLPGPGNILEAIRQFRNRGGP